MKKSLFPFMIAFSAFFLFSLVSCKKSDNNSADYTSEFKIQTDDHSKYSSDADDVLNDISWFVDSVPALRGRGTQVNGCNTTFTVDSAARTATITFNGLNCSGTRSRTGSVLISLTNKWKQAGTKLTLTFQNLKITRLSDNKSLTLNGTEIITNTSGGTLAGVYLTGTTVIHDIVSGPAGLKLTFDDGTERNWQVSKRRVFSKNSGVILLTTTGTYSDGTNNDIAEWGNNRQGKPFTARIVTPLVFRQDCDFRLTSGKIIFTKLIVPITVTFGLDASGNPASCPGTGSSYFFKAEWTGIGGTAKSYIGSY